MAGFYYPGMFWKLFSVCSRLNLLIFSFFFSPYTSDQLKFLILFFSTSTTEIRKDRINVFSSCHLKISLSYTEGKENREISSWLPLVSPQPSTPFSLMTLVPNQSTRESLCLRLGFMYFLFYMPHAERLLNHQQHGKIRTSSLHLYFMDSRGRNINSFLFQTDTPH